MLDNLKKNTIRREDEAYYSIFHLANQRSLNVKPMFMRKEFSVTNVFES